MNATVANFFWAALILWILANAAIGMIAGAGGGTMHASIICLTNIVAAIGVAVIARVSTTGPR